MTDPAWLQAADIALVLAVAAFVLQKAIRIRRETSFGWALSVWNVALALVFAWAVVGRLVSTDVAFYVRIVLRAILVAALAWGEWEFRRLRAAGEEPPPPDIFSQ